MSKKFPHKTMKAILFALIFAVIILFAVLIVLQKEHRSTNLDPIQKTENASNEQANNPEKTADQKPVTKHSESDSLPLPTAKTPGSEIPDDSPTAPPDSEETDDEDNTTSSSLEEIRKMFLMYDYDKALAALQNHPEADTEAALSLKSEIEKAKDSLVLNQELPTHVFFHSLIADTSKAFDGDYQSDGYNQFMTTVYEFNRMLEELHKRDFVLISMHDLATLEKDDAGNEIMLPKDLYLPENKKPLIISVDDVNYYDYMKTDGFANRLIIDQNGDVKTTMTQEHGMTKIGDYDVVPLLDKFVDEHPDFSYRGAKGILAFTGYEGVLGYRTDSSYRETNPDFEADKKAATEVAKALREDGWEFASHSWGHIPMGQSSYENMVADMEQFFENVIPILGDIDIMIFPFGEDIEAGIAPYSADNAKFQYLFSKGFRFFCPVDGTSNWTVYGQNHLRQGRKNLDGYRMYYNPEMIADLFDTNEVLDPDRPLPVPPL